MRILPHLFLLALLAPLLPSSARAGDEFEPIPSRLSDRAAVMTLPEGVRRVRLRTRDDQGAWKIHTVVHLQGSEGYLKLRLPDGLASGDLEISASWSDPFPYEFYQGRSKFPGTESQGEFLAVPMFAWDMQEDGLENPATDEPVVEESDIWKWRGTTLYFFNQSRGLQAIDVSEPAAPRRLATLPVDGFGEQMYLHPTADQLVLLTQDPSTGNGEVLLVAHEASHTLQQRASIPVHGSILESRLIGSILYVISRHSWQYSTTGEDGTVHLTWHSGLNITKIDLSNPENPVTLPPLQLANGQYYYWGAQVQATPRALLVSTSAYDPDRRQSISTVHVIDVSDPVDGPRLTRHLPVAGHVLNKYNMHLDGNILTVVSQVWRGTTTRQRYASVETFDLSRDPSRLAGIEFANNESITASRFVGDLLYVVTFLRIDPLFVIDLADPARPRILSELEIPGFSTYLQPHGKDTLLSVGVEDSRIAVSWFDVTDPTAPTLASRAYIGSPDGWAWTEANWDEKAFGYFPEENLLLVPYQGADPTRGTVSGVQLIELGDRELHKRGSIAQEFPARRARVLDDVVVSISGRSLKSLDISDRDRPRLLSEIPLAWPADLVHRMGNLLVQIERGSGYPFQPGTSRDVSRIYVTPADDPDQLLATLDLPGGRVAGSVVVDDCLLVAQERLQTDEVAGESRTELLLGTVVVDLRDPSSPTIAGQTWKTSPAEIPSREFGANYRGALLPDGVLLWYPAKRQTYSRWGILPGVPMFDDIGFFPSMPTTGRIWTVDCSDKEEPVTLATTELARGENWFPEGSVQLVGTTLYHGLQTTEESSHPDGSRMWLSHHWLGTLDLRDPSRPVHGVPAQLPAPFEHAHLDAAGGTVLFTSHTSSAPDPDGTWRTKLSVQALVYDGCKAYLTDELVVPDWSYGPRTFHEKFAILGLHDPAAGTPRTDLAIHEWSPQGSFREVARLARPDSIRELDVHHELLVTRGTDIHFIDFRDPSDPFAAEISFSAVQFWQDSELIEIVDLQAAYLPLGLYGVRTLNFEGAFPPALPVPSPGQEQTPEGEWMVIPLHELRVTSCSGSLILDALLPGEEWISPKDPEPLDFASWSRRVLSLAPDDPTPGPDDDTDCDGATDFWEYVTGTDPRNPLDRVALHTTIWQDGNRRSIRGLLPINPHAVGALQITPRLSFDLQNWHDAPDWSLQASPFAPSLKLECPVPPQEPSAFLKVEVGVDAP